MIHAEKKILLAVVWERARIEKDQFSSKAAVQAKRSSGLCIVRIWGDVEGSGYVSGGKVNRAW